MADQIQADIPLILPSDRLWFDPFVVNSNCQITVYDIVLTFGQTKVVLPANTRRWALTICQGSIQADAKLGPWPDPANGAFFSLVQVQDSRTVTLFTHGPAVCNSWSAFSQNGCTFRMIETVRL